MIITKQEIMMDKGSNENIAGGDKAITRFVKLSPQSAKMIIENHMCDRQRNLRPKRVKHLAS